MKTTPVKCALAAVVLLSSLNSQLAAAPMGTAFTYQGKLTSGTNAANGVYDFIFVLFNAASFGLPQGPTVATNAVTVTNGYFLVTLDFGNVFPGDARWLEISVKTNGAASYTLLTPRQPLTPVPYAIMAHSASNLLGTLPAGSVGAVQLASGAVTGDKIASGTISNVNISSSGIDAGKIIGGDLQAARLKVGLGQTLSGFYATIAGGQLNTASGGFGTVGGGGNNLASGWGATVGGGGGNAATNSETTVAGGSYNVAGGPFANVSGGYSNNATGLSSAVGGGFHNNAAGLYATIGGGSNNVVTGDFSAVGGGFANVVSGSHSAVGGGDGNTANNWDATVGGGNGNTASGGSATVGGGSHNNATGQTSTVAGGDHNNAGDIYSSVGGGYQNSATNASTTVAGGWGNLAGANAATVGGGAGNSATGPYSAIAGGGANSASGNNAFVAGGDHNGAAGDFSLAAGRRAKANHAGAFVWADSQVADFSSTANNQFLIRASGGVSIGTNDPGGAALNVAGPVRATTFQGDGSGLTSLNVSSLGGTITNTITFNPPSGPPFIAANQNRATGLNADFLDGWHGDHYWQQGGNASVTPGDFLGSTCNSPLEFVVNSQRALRLEPNTSGAPNVIGGAAVNSVSGGSVGATIAGGGAVNWYGQAYSNCVNESFGSIGGGRGNTIEWGGTFSTIGGGCDNTIAGGWATIAGGDRNSIPSAVGSSSIGGGCLNTNKAYYGTIGGGLENVIEEDAFCSCISGGEGNALLTNTEWATIGGGRYNTIRPDAKFATIGGGEGNRVEAPRGTVAGGTAAVAHNYGQWAYASGVFFKPGDAQTSLYVLRGQTVSDAGYQELFLDGTQSRLQVPTNTVWTFHILVVGYLREQAATTGYEGRGVIENANGRTYLLFCGLTKLYQSVWDDFVVGGDSSGNLLLKAFTPSAPSGQPPYHQKWVARVETVELTP